MHDDKLLAEESDCSVIKTVLLIIETTNVEEYMDVDG